MQDSLRRIGLASLCVVAVAGPFALATIAYWRAAEAVGDPEVAQGAIRALQSQLATAEMTQKAQRLALESAVRHAREAATERRRAREAIEAATTPSVDAAVTPPVFFRRINGDSREPAIHAAPTLQTAEVADGIALHATPSPENENVILQRFELWRRAPADNEFVKLHTRKPKDQRVVFLDRDVKRGQLYWYRLVSIAARDAEAPEHIAPPERARTTTPDIPIWLPCEPGNDDAK